MDKNKMLHTAKCKKKNKTKNYKLERTFKRKEKKRHKTLNPWRKKKDNQNFKLLYDKRNEKQYWKINLKTNVRLGESITTI